MLAEKFSNSSVLHLALKKRYIGTLNHLIIHSVTSTHLDSLDFHLNSLLAYTEKKLDQESKNRIYIILILGALLRIHFHFSLDVNSIRACSESQSPLENLCVSQ